MMKTKTILFAFAVVLLAGLSSCSGGYTCPTYMQDDSMNKTEVLVQQETNTIVENI